MEKKSGQTEITNYINQNAPVLFLRLNPAGKILEMNRFAKKIIGEQFINDSFLNTILDFNQKFEISNLTADTEENHLLSIKTQSGNPQSYQFYFFNPDDQILAFGHMDVNEIESLSDALLSANQDLNNLIRELNVKNKELKRANAKIIEISRTDPLTGLANRRYFAERLKETMSLSTRNSKPLSLIMTDIDHFKKVNDTFGHDIGDTVLKGYAELMIKGSRKEDLVVRFGGEEFIILLPLTSIQEAFTIAERIRISLSKTDLIGGNNFITASYGISQLIENEKSKHFIKRADDALYMAKNSGRNKTILSTFSSSTTPPRRGL